jgi:hypothetical protein
MEKPEIPTLAQSGGLWAEWVSQFLPDAVGFAKQIKQAAREEGMMINDDSALIASTIIYAGLMSSD